MSNTRLYEDTLALYRPLLVSCVVNTVFEVFTELFEDALDYVRAIGKSKDKEALYGKFQEVSSQVGDWSVKEIKVTASRVKSRIREDSDMETSSFKTLLQTVLVLETRIACAANGVRFLDKMVRKISSAKFIHSCCEKVGQRVAHRMPHLFDSTIKSAGKNYPLSACYTASLKR